MIRVGTYRTLIRVLFRIANIIRCYLDGSLVQSRQIRLGECHFRHDVLGESSIQCLCWRFVRRLCRHQSVVLERLGTIM
jgi:hypothetical protein